MCDNGVTGSWGIIYPDSTYTHFITPVRKCLSYTKVKQNISRVDVPALKEKLQVAILDRKLPSITLLERPLVNPGRFKATMSAVRALEATLIVLEDLKLPYMYVDSREWQSVMLPKNTIGDQLKIVSKQVAERLFPSLVLKKDGDSMLGAEWARRTGL